jgi:hypothetical protein
MFVKCLKGFGARKLEASVFHVHTILKSIVNRFGSLVHSLVYCKVRTNDYQFDQAVLVAGDSPFTITEQGFERAVYLVIEALSLLSDGREFSGKSEIFFTQRGGLIGVILTHGFSSQLGGSLGAPGCSEKSEESLTSAEKCNRMQTIMRPIEHLSAPN